VQIITSVIGARSNSTEDDEVCDARLIASVFEILRLHDARYSQNGVTESTGHLEMSLIQFLKKFARLYFHEGNIDSKMHQAIAERHGFNDPSQVIEAIINKVFVTLCI
jgi:hypothetical protein